MKRKPSFYRVISLALGIMMLISVLSISPLSISGAESTVLMGDADRDGSVNGSDIALLVRYLSGWNADIDIAAADMDENGKVNNRDAIMMIFKESVNGIAMPSEPKLTADAVGYVSYGDTSGLCTSSNSNSGLSDTESKHGWGAVSGDGVMSLMADGGTVVSTGRGMFGIDYTFEKTSSPVLITARYRRSYRDGNIVNEEGTGNGTQRGTFILGDNAVTVSFAGDYLLEGIDIFTRNKNGGATISVLGGARVVFGRTARITNMQESSKHPGNESPTLNVQANGYVFLYTLGFDRYTGSGTIVLSDALIESGKATAETFENFKGRVVDKNGSTVLIPAQSYEAPVQPQLPAPAEPSVSSTAVGYISYGSTSGLCTSSNSNSGLSDTESKHGWGALSGDGVMSLVPSGGTVVSTGRGMFGIDYTFEKTTTPVLVTASYGGVDYRDGSIVNNAGTGNGTQKGTFILGDKAVIVTFAGDYIIDNIDIFTRNKTGGATISVLSGAKVVFGAGANITDMTASSNHTSSKAPTLNIEQGGYVYLYTSGFESYTGSGTLVLARDVVSSGMITEADLVGFTGSVIYADGSSVFATTGAQALNKLGAVSLNDGAIYKITADGTGKVLTAENFGSKTNSAVKLSVYEKDLSQLWRACKNSDGTYTLKNMANGEALYFGSGEEKNTLPTLALCAYNSDDITKGWSLRLDATGITGVVLANDYTSLVACVLDTGYAGGSAYASYSCDTWSFEKVSDGEGEYPELLVLSGDYIGSSSCPEILYHDGVYYNYNMTGSITLKTSTDLVNWKLHEDKTALSERPAWLEDVSGSDAIWAPGAYKIGDRYYLYYCTSTSGSRNSGIGVAVSDDPSANDWQDLGLVLRSYDPTDSFNAIDPNVFVDDDGRAYLIYGSYWEGIFMRELDTATGKLSEENTTVYHLAKGSSDMEAPYLVKRGDYYYLFVARGSLSKGTYYWAVGRSTNLTGPFYDKDGVSMLSGEGGTRLTEWKEGVMGVAHAQCFFDRDGETYMVSEYWSYRTEEATSSVHLMISKMVWTDEQWPVTVLDPDVLTALGE